MDKMALAASLAGIGVVAGFAAFAVSRKGDQQTLYALAGMEPREELWLRFSDGVGPLLTPWFPLITLDKLKQKLQAAGNPFGLEVEGFVGLKILCAIGALTLGWFLALLGFPTILIGPFIVIGYLAPDGWLSGVVERRQQEIYRLLPDMIGILITTLRAGVELGLAFELVGKKMPGALGEEVRRCWREIATGIPRSLALRTMAKRTKLTVMERFVQSVIMAEERGVSVADTLANFMSDVRDSQRRKAEEEARKMPTKMLAPMILCIFLPMLVILITPVVFIFTGLLM